jgi:hypothetical protein
LVGFQPSQGHLHARLTKVACEAARTLLGEMQEARDTALGAIAPDTPRGPILPDAPAAGAQEETSPPSTRRDLPAPRSKVRAVADDPPCDDAAAAEPQRELGRATQVLA